MSWQDVLKDKQDLTEPLELDALYGLIDNIDLANNDLQLLHERHSENIKSRVSPEAHMKWFTSLEGDKRRFIGELNDFKRNVHVMLRTLNGKTAQALRGE
jgi:hypothetical protein|tara:strand:+ start:27 stop:326 length:300 start_codon:yes stop_codon:yes gene_type:complete